MTNHTHRVKTTSEPWPYTHGVAINADHENRAAHGNIGETETCVCGHERKVLHNRRQEEAGPWRARYEYSAPRPKRTP